MHGFLGCIESDKAAADAMGGWMKKWIALRPEKRLVEVRRHPLLFVTSDEPGTTGAPVASGDDGLTVGFCGFIAHDQLEAADGSALTTDAEVAEALLARYRAEGGEALAALNGRYLAWAWRADSGRLELMNDALGFKPVFLWRKNAAVVFASNVWAIVRHPRFDGVVDARGLVDTLLLSHQQGGRTLFEDVSLLPPGSVTCIQDGKAVSRVVRNLRFTEERWAWSVERIADAMHGVLSQSIRRRVPEHLEVLLPLSGGLDSRVLLGLLAARSAEIDAVSQYQHGLYGIDARCARQLARAAAVKHRIVPLRDDFLARYRRKCVAINSGMYDIHTGRFLSLLDLAGAGDVPTVSGFFGGEITGRFQISDAAFCTPEEQFELGWREINMYRFQPDRLRGMLASGVSADAADDAVAESKRFLLSHDGHYFHRHYNWDILMYRRRYISYQLLYYEQFQRVIAPFCDRDVVDFFCSLPFAALEAQRAYCQMQVRHFPKLSRVPNSNTGQPLRISTKYILKDVLSSQYMRFIRRPLQRALKLRRWIGHPCSQLGFALGGDSRPVLDHIIRSKDRLADHLHPDKVQEAVDRLLEGDNTCSMGLLALSSFATALEMLEDPGAALRAWEEDG